MTPARSTAAQIDLMAYEGLFRRDNVVGRNVTDLILLLSRPRVLAQKRGRNLPPMPDSGTGYPTHKHIWKARPEGRILRRTVSVFQKVPVSNQTIAAMTQICSSRYGLAMRLLSIILGHIGPLSYCRKSRHLSHKPDDDTRRFARSLENGTELLCLRPPSEANGREFPLSERPFNDCRIPHSIDAEAGRNPCNGLRFASVF